jgi:uncharacterized protein HemX
MGTPEGPGYAAAMPSPPSPPRPRLVRPDEAPPAPAAPDRDGRRAASAWLLPLALAAALVAAAGWGLEARRATELAGRVAALEGALGAARAEIGARQRHLDLVRRAVVEAEAGMAALRVLAERDPAAAPEPSPAARPGGE